MTPISHPACNDTLGPPPGVSEKECRTLPILRGDGSVTSFWVPEPSELASLNDGGCIFLCIQGSTHPPLSIGTSPGNHRALDEEGNLMKIITQEQVDGLLSELESLRQWRAKEFDDNGDGAFNVRRLRARVKELEARLKSP